MSENNYNEFAPEPDELTQGEKELLWLKQRAGNFTGSRNKDLMSCARSGSKLSWGDPEKLFSFGAKAEKYIYQVAQERITGFMSNNIRSFNFDYGHENEPKVIKAILERDCLSDHKEGPFLLSPEVGHLGATPDGSIEHINFGRCALEVKSTVSWDGHHTRMSQAFDSKHGDFWQWQTEMHVLGVKTLLFVVAYPMEYKHYEINKIDASEIHIKALLDRVKIANRAITLFRESDKEIYIQDAIRKAVEIARNELK